MYYMIKFVQFDDTMHDRYQFPSSDNGTIELFNSNPVEINPKEFQSFKTFVEQHSTFLKIHKQHVKKIFKKIKKSTCNTSIMLFESSIEKYNNNNKCRNKLILDLHLRYNDLFFDKHGNAYSRNKIYGYGYDNFPTYKLLACDKIN